MPTLEPKKELGFSSLPLIFILVVVAVVGFTGLSFYGHLKEFGVSDGGYAETFTQWISEKVLGKQADTLQNAKSPFGDISNTPPEVTETNDKPEVNTNRIDEVLSDIPTQKTLPGGRHYFQTFNNCGPASLSMTLSLYGINVSQKAIGDDLRPYQIASGDNDDKSVTLPEIAEKSKEYGFIPYHRPNGNIDLIKKFIANDIPVITRTWLKADEDIGHFRVVKGYNSQTNEIIQDDSYQGKDLVYKMSDFDVIWKKFNYEYLVIVPEDKKEIAEVILGSNLDYTTAWTRAAEMSEKILSENPEDVYARFNLSVALYNMGEYKRSVEEFEKVENKLSFRTLWYQIEPILAYYELKQYDRVFEITDKILNNGNKAFSELYIVRGKIYLAQDQKDKARQEFEKAVLYNKNLDEAQEMLNSVK